MRENPECLSRSSLSFLRGAEDYKWCVLLSTRFLICAASASILLRYESSAFQARLIVIGALLRAFRQCHFFLRQRFAGNQAEYLSDAVEARAFLVVGPHNVPRRIFSIGRFQHHVTRPGVVVPPHAGRKVCRAELPLP